MIQANDLWMTIGIVTLAALYALIILIIICIIAQGYELITKKQNGSNK